MAYQDIYRLLSWMAMGTVLCAFYSEQEQAWARNSCWRRHALAIYLAIMTVVPGRKFHPTAKYFTAPHDVASWGWQDYVRFADANLLQKILDAICNYECYIIFTKR
jgi:hypothetical protein